MGKKLFIERTKSKNQRNRYLEREKYKKHFNQHGNDHHNPHNQQRQSYPTHNHNKRYDYMQESKFTDNHFRKSGNYSRYTLEQKEHIAPTSSHRSRNQDVNGNSRSSRINRSVKTNIIFVGNLNYECEEGEIWRFFERCGPIVDVRIAYNPSGSKKGFCHVEYESHVSAERAMDLD
jgi:hypothetical protein